MDIDGDDKASGEILRSLLLTSKIDSSNIPNEITALKPVDQSEQNINYLQQEQMVWKIESNSTGEQQQFITESPNLIQQIPVTYLMTNDRTLTFVNTRTVLNPFTYVVSETPKYCAVEGTEASVILNDQQNLVLVQEVNSNVSETENPCDVKGRVFTVREKESPSEAIEPVCNAITITDGAPNMVQLHSFNVDVKCSSKSERSGKVEKKIKNRKIKTNASDSTKGLTKMKKVERIRKKPLGSAKSKVLGRKKGAKKRRSSKLKSALKPGLKSQTVPVQSIVCGKSSEKMEDDLVEKNLFELTKLEDNVEQVSERLSLGCDCADSNCFDGLNPEKVFRHRLNIADLTKAEHDMYLMGVIMASVQNLEETCRRKERIRIRSCYAYQGKKVCLTAFLYLQHVTLYQMKRLRSHLKSHGVSPRIHGNRGRKPANTFSLDTYHCATDFIQKYIEKHSVKSVPNFTTFSLKKHEGNPASVSQSLKKKMNKVRIANKITSYHLPSECTKKTVHREYKSFCETLNQKAMKYSTFTSFLQKQFPNVKFNKVDKRVVEKCGRDEDARKPNKDKGEESNGSADKCVQTPTVAYIPGKNLESPAGAGESDKRIGKNSQIVSGKQLQWASGNGNESQTDFKLPERLLLGHPGYGTQYLGHGSGTAHQMFAANNVT